MTGVWSRLSIHPFVSTPDCHKSSSRSVRGRNTSRCDLRELSSPLLAWLVQAVTGVGFVCRCGRRAALWAVAKETACWADGAAWWARGTPCWARDSVALVASCRYSLFLSDVVSNLSDCDSDFLVVLGRPSAVLGPTERPGLVSFLLTTETSHWTDILLGIIVALICPGPLQEWPASVRNTFLRCSVICWCSSLERSLGLMCASAQSAPLLHLTPFPNWYFRQIGAGRFVL